MDEARIFPTGDNWIAVYLLDLTEKKKAEQTLERLSTLNLVGQMAASIGHEVRNPLTNVRGYLQWLMQKPHYEAESAQFKVMIEEIDRATSILKEFLSLASNRRTSPEVQDINDLIRALSPLLFAQAAEFDRKCSMVLESTHKVNIDSKEIRQLVLNLFKNAVEATDTKGSITIKTFSRDDNVILAISNDGNPIPAEVLEKLGTPFYTTKPGGTGLGLAICYSIAARHKAELKVTSQNGETTFALHLPIAN